MSTSDVSPSLRSSLTTDVLFYDVNVRRFQMNVDPRGPHSADHWGLTTDVLLPKHLKIKLHDQYNLVK